jgi:8-oxo-dGTP pyrophosphatase MutT (NUDIX family)
MYKVFIDNRPICFTEKNQKGTDVINIPSSKLNSMLEVNDTLTTVGSEKRIFIVCKMVQEEVDRLFKDFDKVEAAGGIVRRKKRLLFIKRHGIWDIPKGKLEENEDVEVCAVREIEEECGIIGPVIQGDLGVTYHTYSYHGIQTIKKTYWYYLSYKGPKELVPQTEEGIEKVKWYKFCELEKIRENTYETIKEVIDNYIMLEGDRF